MFSGRLWGVAVHQQRRASLCQVAISTQRGRLCSLTGLSRAIWSPKLLRGQVAVSRRLLEEDTIGWTSSEIFFASNVFCGSLDESDGTGRRTCLFGFSSSICFSLKRFGWGARVQDVIN